MQGEFNSDATGDLLVHQRLASFAASIVAFGCAACQKSDARRHLISAHRVHISCTDNTECAQGFAKWRAVSKIKEAVPA